MLSITLFVISCQSAIALNQQLEQSSGTKTDNVGNSSAISPAKGCVYTAYSDQFIFLEVNCSQFDNVGREIDKLKQVNY